MTRPRRASPNNPATKVRNAIGAADEAAAKNLNLTTRQLRKVRNDGLKATADSFQNFSAMLGMGANNLLSRGTYGFDPITRIRTLLEWIHRGNWLGGVAVDIVADDMTRAGVDILGELEPDKIAEIEKECVRLAIWPRLNSTVKWSRLYGGSIAAMLVDGQDPATPFNEETLTDGQFRGFAVLDRWMTQPSLNDLVTDFGPDLGMPKYYTVTYGGSFAMGTIIHYSRVIRLEGIELPYIQRLVENLWGLAIYERLYDRMVAFDSATMGAAQLAFKAHLRVVKMKGLREIIATDGTGKKKRGLLSQFALMREIQSSEGITLLDADDEFETHTADAFSGVDSVVRQLGEQMTGGLQFPLSRLFGQDPGGLGKNADSGLRTYYDGIRQKQETYMAVGLTRAYRAVAFSKGIDPPEDFGISFRPLWQLAETDKSSIATQTVEAISTVKAMGIVSDQTLLKELKQSSKATGLMTNITSEEIEAASDVPVPPMELAMGAGGEGEDGGAGGNGGAPGGKNTADEPLMTKMEVQYSDRARGSNRCGLCQYFNDNRTCQLVAGRINPDGWCVEFQKYA